MPPFCVALLAVVLLLGARLAQALCPPLPLLACSWLRGRGPAWVELVQEGPALTQRFAQPHGFVAEARAGSDKCLEVSSNPEGC